MSIAKRHPGRRQRLQAAPQPFKLRVADAGAGPARISQPPLRIRTPRGQAFGESLMSGRTRLDLKHAEEPVVCMTLRWRKQSKEANPVLIYKQKSLRHRTGN